MTLPPGAFIYGMVVVPCHWSFSNLGLAVLSCYKWLQITWFVAYHCCVYRPPSIDNTLGLRHVGHNNFTPYQRGRGRLVHVLCYSRILYVFSWWWLQLNSLKLLSISEYCCTFIRIKPAGFLTRLHWARSRYIFSLYFKNYLN